MHTAFEIDSSMFTVEASGLASTRDELLQWEPRDRLGVVTRETFGALGVGLLTLLSITAFFDAPAQKRRSRPLYPDIYLFHVGRYWGFYGGFDFWPDRKEILVTDAVDALRSINSHGITHLAVPDGPVRATAHRYKEPESAVDRIKQCFAYGADGAAADADVILRSSSANVLKNFSSMLNLEATLEKREESRAARRRRPAEAEDAQRYTDIMRARLAEMPSDEAAAHAKQRWLDATAAGELTERLRRIDVQTALCLLG